MTSIPTVAFDTQAADQARMAQIRTTIGDIEQMLAVATALIACGRRVELVGLESSIGRLCAGALDLSPQDGRTFRPALADLLTRINALEAALRQDAASR